jgi:hypothetical protein
LASLDQWLRGQVEADHLSRRQPLGQTPSDAPRPTADIEQSHAGVQVRQEECGSFLGGSPRVMA